MEKMKKAISILLLSYMLSFSSISLKSTRNEGFDLQEHIANNSSKSFIEQNFRKGLIEYSINLEMEQKSKFYLKAVKYSEDFGFEQQEALAIIYENLDNIKNEHVNEDVGIIRTLIKHYNLNVENKDAIVSNLTNEEREKLILNYMEIFEINDPLIVSTILAIYRLETGYGNSNLCVNHNNLGGHTITNKNTGVRGQATYKTVKMGAAAFVNVSNYIYNQTESKEMEIEQRMATLYSTDPIWPEKVALVREQVQKDYPNLIGIEGIRPKVKKLV